MPVNRIAPQIPLEIDEERGKYKEYAMTDLTKVVDQNIKMVLLTSPGERIMNPNFGVGMRKYLFENQTTINRGTQSLPPLRENIISQLSTYVPYISIQELDIGGSSYENMLKVKIKYYVTESGTASTFELTVSEVRDNTL
jgi:phage baseplate assembly protein W